MNCEETLASMFDAWDTLVAKSNDPSISDHELTELWDWYEETMEALAITNGHPPGRPRRRP